MIKILIFFLLFFGCAINANQDINENSKKKVRIASVSSLDTVKEGSSKEDNKAQEANGFKVNQGVLEIDVNDLSQRLNLSKWQEKSIKKLYKKYQKKQLKLKEKYVVYQVKLQRLMLESKWQKLMIKLVVEDLYYKRGQMEVETRYFLKQLEKKLKKDQQEIFRKQFKGFY